MVERWFACRERGSTWSVEVMAGLSSFLALSYIFVVNPAILGSAGMPRQGVFFATVLVSGLATIVMGLCTNLPFVLAPGMEINTYVAVYAIGVMHLSWREALGAVFWSGVLFLILTLSGVRRRIVESFPRGLERGVAVAVAALLTAVALRGAGVLRYDGIHLTGFGRPGAAAALLLITSLIVFALAAAGIRAAVLASIIGGSLVAAAMHYGGAAHTEGNRSGLLAAFGAADLSVITRPSAWTIILVLFLIDFYGSIAKLIGLVRNTGLMRNGRLPKLREALLIDGMAATAGGLAGTTSVLVYAESGVGIAAGGRTGLTALTAGIAMLGCLVAAPLLAYVPAAAVGGALLHVAFRLMPRRTEWRSLDAWELVIIAGMAGIVFTTFSLDGALLFGLAVQIVRDFSNGVRLNAYAAGSVALLLIGWVLSK